jgi:hypothetical protein
VGVVSHGQAAFWIILAVVAGTSAIVNALVWQRCRRRQRTESYVCRVSASRHAYSVWGSLGFFALFIVRIVTQTY